MPREKTRSVRVDGALEKRTRQMRVSTRGVRAARRLGDVRLEARVVPEPGREREAALGRHGVHQDGHLPGRKVGKRERLGKKRVQRGTRAARRGNPLGFAGEDQHDTLPRLARAALNLAGERLHGLVAGCIASAGGVAARVGKHAVEVVDEKHAALGFLALLRDELGGAPWRAPERHQVGSARAHERPMPGDIALADDVRDHARQHGLAHARRARENDVRRGLGAPSGGDASPIHLQSVDEILNLRLGGFLADDALERARRVVLLVLHLALEPVRPDDVVRPFTDVHLPVVLVLLVLHLLDVLHRDEDAESGLAPEQPLAVVLPVALARGALLVQPQAHHRASARELRGAHEHNRPFPAAHLGAVADVHLVRVRLERRHELVLL